MGGAKRKLIEVALPLEAINRESAREKEPFTRNHPRSLHIWWARRPLAACRAVLFAQLVDDPSARPDLFSTEEEQAKERRRLFDLIERLVKWENTNDEALLKLAYHEIAACFDGDPPAILDPFAGGGSIPLEAQRLGLEAHASDLNPVAVLINKALIEIPSEFVGRPPVFPGAAESRLGGWPRATGLAEDVLRYGQWMRDEAEKRIGHLYPKAKLPISGEANVVAWIWARTVACPNPACGIRMPLVRSWWLCKKKGKFAWLRPMVTGGRVTFDVATQGPGPDVKGTIGRQGGVCINCLTPFPLAYVRVEGEAGRMGKQLLAVVAEGSRQRLYLPASEEQIKAADISRPSNVPDADLPAQALGFRVQRYGIKRWADLFTNRQLAAMATLTELLARAGEKLRLDAEAAGLSFEDRSGYAESVKLILGLTVSKYADLLNTICTWNITNQNVTHLFTRQAIPMSWDFTETNPIGPIGFDMAAESAHKSLLGLRPTIGRAVQADARRIAVDQSAVVCTDPPYYDNIAYADLADFFYVWLRMGLVDSHAETMGTMLSPKSEELVAAPSRFGGSIDLANEHFESGFVGSFSRLKRMHQYDVPLVVFYAFKQAESDDSGTASTGWEKMLSGLMDAGLSVTATWPIRTERATRTRGIDSNALASSVVLACRPLPGDAVATTRRAFLKALTNELPAALKELQQGSIAPVDLAQAAIGPGMAIFTRYAKVVEPDGSDMTVRMALALINQALDEVLAEQEGDFDTDTRFCVKWFTQLGWDEGETGTADTLSRATNTSVGGLERGGIFWAKAGKARLLRPEELSPGWDPETDARVSVWEVVVRLGQELQTGGIESAAQLMARAGRRVDLDTAKELAYLLFSICEKRRDNKSAILFNSLGTSWSDLSAAARTGGALTPPPAQGEFDFDALEE